MVLEGYIEGLVNRFCGRWLTQFSRDNLEINMVEGKVVLRDVHVNTHEIEELCLPFTPRQIYMGKIYVQVPLTVSRPLKIEVTDALVLIRASTTDSGFFDVRQALQSHIHMLTLALESQFQALAACTTNLQRFISSTSAKTTYIPVLQRLELVIRNLHVRIEDTTVDTPVPLALGLLISTASTTPLTPSPEDKRGNVRPEDEADPTLVAKAVKAEGVALYADHDKVLSLMTAEEVISTMRGFTVGRGGYVVEPVDLSLQLRYLLAHNKIDVQLHCPSLRVCALHDQLHVLLSWGAMLGAHLPMLQRHTLRAGSSIANAATLRWRLALTSVLSDVRAHTQRGHTWHARLRTWVDACRYQTIRALLRRHVGVVTFTDDLGMKQERFYERLLPVSFDDGSLGEMARRRLEAEWFSYMLPYELPPSDIAAARALVSQHAMQNLANLGLSHASPVPLPPRMVQCLYALQLELDARLPLSLVLFLRLDVDYRLRQFERFGPPTLGLSPGRKHATPDTTPPPEQPQAQIQPQIQPQLQPQMAPAVGEPSAPAPRPTRLLLALAHGDRFRPLLASSTVDALCRLTLLAPGGKVTRKSDSQVGRYDGKEGVHWHELFVFDLRPEHLPRTPPSPTLPNEGATAPSLPPVDEDKAAPLLQLECVERMALLDLGLGSCTLSRDQLLSQAERPVAHVCPLQGGSGSGLNFLGPTSSDADKAPTVTLLSLLYDPSVDERADLRAQSLIQRTLSGLKRRRSGEGPPSGLSDLTDLAQLHARQPPLRRASSLAQQQQAAQGQAGGEGAGEREEQGREGEGDGADPLLLAFPRLWLGASVEGLRLTVGVARYHEVVRHAQATGANGHATEEEEEAEAEDSSVNRRSGEEEEGIVRLRTTGERRFTRRRTLLLEVVARSIESLSTFWARAGEGEEDGGREGATKATLRVASLEAWDRQQPHPPHEAQDGPCTPRSLGSDDESESDDDPTPDPPSPPLARVGPLCASLDLHTTLPDSLTTLARVLSWSLDVTLGNGYGVRLSPRHGDLPTPPGATVQTLCTSERFFHHPQAVTHVLSASTPLPSSPPSSSSSSSSSLLRRLSLSFLNARHCVSLEYTHAGGDLLHPPPVGPPMGPLVLAEDYVATDACPASDAAGSSKALDVNAGGRGKAVSERGGKTAAAGLPTLQVPCSNKVGAGEGGEAKQEEGLRETVMRLQREVEFWKGKARQAGVDVDRESTAMA